MKKEKMSIEKMSFMLSIVLGIVLLAFFAVIISHVFFYPETHVRERKNIEKIAKEYIEQAHPYFVAVEINAEYGWYENRYNVICVDKYDRVIELSMATDGSDLYDNYSGDDVYDIRWLHEGPMAISIEKVLAEKTGNEHRVGITNIDIDKGLVTEEDILAGYDMSNDRMGCVISLEWNKGETMEQLCEKMIPLKEIVMDIEQYNIVQVDFNFWGTAGSGYLSYPMGQENVTDEELVGLIGYLVEFKK